jgi:hypothetical protein
MTTYKLNKETKGKKHLYTVTDESGNVISTRTSARDYVACTINGEFYFGRLDLIGKGDHGRAIRHGRTTPIAYLTQADEKDDREQTITAGEKTKEAPKELFPYRMNYNTVIFIDPDQDIQKQVKQARKRLGLD